MAEEIKVVASLQVDNGLFHLPKAGPSIVKIDQNNPGGGVPGTVTVTVGGIDIDLSPPALGTPGWVRMENTDPTNFVEFGIYNGGIFYPLGKMLPGEPALFRLAISNFRLKANTADCLVLVQACED